MEIEFVRTKRRERRVQKGGTRLNPKELQALADRMVASRNPADVARLKQELERGFYCDPDHA
jgi:hypothetical protein